MKLGSKKTNCWRGLFESAVIALDPRVQPNGDNKMEVEISLMIQLAAVEYPVIVDGGIVLLGYSTVLIPICHVDNQTILWHFESAKHNSQLKTNELRAVKGSWLRKPRLDDLLSEKALLGWCPEAVMLLGTGRLDRPVQWSDARTKHTTWNWKSANLQLVAQSASPLQIGGQAGVSFNRVVNTLQFSPASNYLKCLTSSSMEQMVIYDVSQQRAWLVPLACVLHQMLFEYWKKVPEPFRKDVIPAADPASNGPLASVAALRDNSGCVIQESGNEQLTVRDLILGFSANLSKTSLQKPHRSEIYGYEFMDIIMDSTKSELKRTKIEREGLSWISLLGKVNCLFCADLGDAIFGLRADIPSSPCNQLPMGLYWMATTMRSIDALAQRYGSNTGAPRRFSGRHFWILKGMPFQRCQHGTHSQDSCWKTGSFLQKLEATGLPYSTDGKSGT